MSQRNAAALYDLAQLFDQSGIPRDRMILQDPDGKEVVLGMANEQGVRQVRWKGNSFYAVVLGWQHPENDIVKVSKEPVDGYNLFLAKGPIDGSFLMDDGDITFGFQRIPIVRAVQPQTA